MKLLTWDTSDSHPQGTVPVEQMIVPQPAGVPSRWLEEGDISDTEILGSAAIPASGLWSYTTCVGGCCAVHLTTYLYLFKPHGQLAGYRTRCQADSVRRSDTAPSYSWQMSGCHRVAAMVRVGSQLKRNLLPRWERISSSRTTKLRIDTSWTPAHNRRTRLSASPTVAICSPTWSRLLGRVDNKVVESGLLNRPASSARQTPRRDVDSHGHSCVQSGSPGFSAHDSQ